MTKTAINIDRLRRLKEEGLSDSAVADRIGTSFRAVRDARLEYNIPVAHEGSAKRISQRYDTEAHPKQKASDELIAKLYNGRQYDDMPLKKRGK